MSSDAVRRYIKRVREDFMFFAEHEFTLVNEARKEQKLITLFPPQLRIILAVMDAIANNRPFRGIVLKARRHGISLATCALFSWLLHRWDNTVALVTTDKSDDEAPLYKMYATAYEHMSPEVRHAMTERKDSYHKFTLANKSSLEIRTAMVSTRKAGAGQGSSGVARGSRLSLVHFSEWAFYANGADLRTAVMQALSEEPGTIFLGESTANGMGGDFYETWLQAVNDQTDMQPFFFPWFDHPSYRGSVLAKRGNLAYMPTPQQLDLYNEFRGWYEMGDIDNALRVAYSDLHLDKEETDLLITYPQLDIDQLLWRRFAIRNKIPSGSRFDTEYPHSWQVAFAASGRSRFDNQKVMFLINKAKETPPEAVDLKPGADQKHWDWRNNAKKNPKLVCAPPSEEDKALHVVKHPLPGHEYIIGADAARGIGQDRSALVVLDRTARKFVAYLGSRHIDPTLLAMHMIKVGWYYNLAILCPETNAPGNLTEQVLATSGYPNLYVDNKTSGSGFDYQTVGIQTTLANREKYIAAFDDVLKSEDTVRIPLIPVLQEATTFAILPSTEGGMQKQGHLPGCNDDFLFATMVALEVDRRLGVVERPTDDPVLPQIEQQLHVPWFMRERLVKPIEEELSCTRRRWG